MQACTPLGRAGIGMAEVAVFGDETRGTDALFIVKECGDAGATDKTEVRSDKEAKLGNGIKA